MILTNFNARFTGVSATIANLAEHHERHFKVVILGKPLPVGTRRIGPRQLFRFLWHRPAGRRVRIWHARRTAEMFVGWI
ncbi:MAG TPA: hypothetical protein VE890_02805, partial [Thermoguttaceae bacterium]|nr:hypothetical protein [Thermoguttaceae bacterium]